MAASQMPGFPTYGREEPNLTQKLERTSAEKGTNPYSTVVNVDLSNVSNWKVDSLGPGNEPLKYRVSIKSLARLLSKNQYFKEVRVFMPSVHFNDELLKSVTEWTMRECPEVLCNSRFATDDDSETFGFKLGIALDNFLSYQERRAISRDVLESVETLIRSTYSSMNADMFAEAGCKIYRRAETSFAKTLASDRQHSKVVARILDTLDQIAKVNEDLLDGDGTPPDSGSKEAKIKVVRELTAAARNIVQHDQSHHRKCDLDVDIAAESMDPQTLATFDNQVFLTGDGDFERLYRKLNNIGKNVIVVSPDEYLSTLIRKMANTRVVTVHKPNFVEDIWRSVPRSQAAE
jgi:uncharacterized LabA/DUF88 family protein